MVLKGCLIMVIYITVGLAVRCFHERGDDVYAYVHCTWEEKCVVDSEGTASCEQDNWTDSWIVLCAAGAVLVGLAVCMWYYCKKRGFRSVLGNACEFMSLCFLSVNR